MQAININKFMKKLSTKNKIEFILNITIKISPAKVSPIPTWLDERRWLVKVPDILNTNPIKYMITIYNIDIGSSLKTWIESIKISWKEKMSDYIKREKGIIKIIKAIPIAPIINNNL